MSKQTDLKLAKQYFEEAVKLHAQADSEKAIELFRKSMALCEKWKQWAQWLHVGHHIGDVYVLSKKNIEGISFLNHVVEVGASHLERDHPNFAKCFNYLGDCYSRLNNYHSALEFHQKALAIWKNCLDENHPNLSIVFSNVGKSYALLQDYDFAIIYMQESLRIQEANGETRSFPIAVILSNIGLCLEYKGEYDLAIEYFEQSLSIRQEFFGEQHPKTIDPLSNMGIAYRDKKDYETAIHYFEKATHIVEQSLGETHPLLEFDLINLGVCHCEMQKYDLGMQYFQRVISINEKNFGSEYPGTSKALLNLGKYYAQEENYTLALESFQKGLIVLNKDFLDTNIYHNPPNFAYWDVDTLKLLYVHKATSLLERYQEKTQNSKDLLGALATIQVGIAFISDLRQSYKMEGSVHTLAKGSSFVYDDSIRIGLEVMAWCEQQSTLPTYTGFPHLPKSLEEVKGWVFGFSEQCKATLLLSNLNDEKAKSTADIPDEILEKEKQIKFELNELDKNILNEEGKGDEKDENLLTQFRNQQFKIKLQHDALIAQIEKEYPEYHQLKYSISTASISDLQSYLKSTDTAIQQFNNPAIILSYHIAKEKIYIFSITSNDFQIATVEKPSQFLK